MATYAKTVLSGSTDGRGIIVAATSGTGTTLHTGPTVTSTLHEIWLYAVHTMGTADATTTAQKLTIQWGNTTYTDFIEVTVQPESGLVLIAPGLLIKGNATPLVVRAFAATTNVISIHGYVNTIT